MNVDWRTFLVLHCSKVFPLLPPQSVKLFQVSSPPQDSNQNYDSIIKTTPRIFMWNMSSSRRHGEGGSAGCFMGTLMDDVSQHDLDHHPPLRVNGLHVSVQKVNISICSWYRHRQVHRHLNVTESKSQMRCSGMVWEEVSGLKHFLLFSPV